MNEHQQHLQIITISQPYGCDGYRLAAKLAFRLQWLLTDDEITVQVARRLGITTEEAEVYNEHTDSFIDKFLLMMQFTAPEVVGSWCGPDTPLISPHRQDNLYRETLQQVVKTIAHTGNRVIIGHAAQVLLADQPGVLHVQVVAPLSQRVAYVMQRELLDEADALAYILSKDRGRARHFRLHYHRNVDNPLSYDLTVNRHAFDIESQVDLICLALKRKVQWLRERSPLVSL